MKDYQAPDPYAPKKGFWWAVDALKRMLFSSGSVGQSILPATWRVPQTLKQESLDYLAKTHQVQFDGGWVLTHDQARLDTLTVQPQGSQPKRYIIRFNGNGGQYQDLVDSMAKDAQTLQAAIIGFNYRGVGNSSQGTAKRYQDLVTDGIAEVQRLLDQGVPAEKILVDGQSLGGSIATMVAKHFHDQGIKIFLWNDRSFATLSAAAAGIVCPESSYPVGESSLGSTLSASGWQVDVASAYNAIDSAYKGYMYIHPSSAQGMGDGVIAAKASLHEAVKTDAKEQAKSSGRPFYYAYGPGHNAPRFTLFASQAPREENLTAQDVYEDFVTTHMP